MMRRNDWLLLGLVCVGFLTVLVVLLPTAMYNNTLDVELAETVKMQDSFEDALEAVRALDSTYAAFVEKVESLQDSCVVGGVYYRQTCVFDTIVVKTIIVRE